MVDSYQRSPNDAHAVTILVGPLPPPITGQSISFELLVRGFRERGLPYGIVNIGGSGFDTFVEKFSLKRATQWLGLMLRYLHLATGRRRIVYLTIAQSWVGFLRDFCIIWWAWIWRHRVVLHLHGGGFGNFYDRLSRWQKWFVRGTWRCAAVIIVLSENLRGMFIFDGELYSKVRVVNNALPEENGNLPLAGKTFPSHRPARVLYLSNLIESKGYLLTLEAIRILIHERGRSVEAHFCGEFVPDNGNNYREAVARKEREFLELVEMGGVKNNVHYHGAVSGKSKQVILIESDFFVLPTQYPNEGQPVSIIEAMAHGLVVLATPVAAIPDMIDNGVSGILIPPQPGAIADALERLLDQQEEFCSISYGAIQRYRKFHTQEAHLNTIIPYILGDDHV